MNRAYDLIIKNAILNKNSAPVDIAVIDGTIANISLSSNNENRIQYLEDAQTVYNAEDNFLCSGFFESHIHLDKACILERCKIKKGDLDEAVEETGKAKEDFTEKDVFERASGVIEMAIKKGTMGLRTFVETDSKTELRSFEAIKRVKNKYAFAIDIEICAFAQEGLTNSSETQKLLKQALSNGADLIGGCPYKDVDPVKHIEMIFDMAQEFDVNVDFHLDFDLDPNNSSIPKISEEAIKRNYKGRVSIGHVTKISAMPKEKRKKMALLLSNAEITLTVLPATDIFLNGRDYDTLIPRGMVNANELKTFGVNTTISSNNILNAFTPYGDASLARMANMYANITQLAKDEEMQEVYKMVTDNAAALLSLPCTIEVGAPATFIILEAKNEIEAIRTISQPLVGFKNGRKTFSNDKAKIYFE